MAPRGYPDMASRITESAICLQCCFWPSRGNDQRLSRGTYRLCSCTMHYKSWEYYSVWQPPLGEAGPDFGNRQLPDLSAGFQAAVRGSFGTDPTSLPPAVFCWKECRWTVPGRRELDQLAPAFGIRSQLSPVLQAFTRQNYGDLLLGRLKPI